MSIAKEIAFIDCNLSDLDCLLAGLRPDVEAVLLSAAAPAPAQIAAALQARGGIAAIHIVAHGQAGEVSFAAGALSRETLREHAESLLAIGEALAGDGQILLWSCHTGQDERGAAFIAALARASGAEVAAAQGPVGAAALGGRWQLDGQGMLPPLTASGMAAYAGVMAKLQSLAFKPISGDGLINGMEETAGVTISGTSSGYAVGDAITVTIGTLSYTTHILDSKGNWSLSATGLSAFADGNYVVTVSGGTASASTMIALDGTAPTVTGLTASGAGIANGSGDLNAGKTATLTMNFSENVTVNGGKPTLMLNDGGTATYVGGSGSGVLTFSYKVAAGQNTSDLAVTSLSLNGAAITDSAGNAANLSGAGSYFNPAGSLQIDTTAPTVSSMTVAGDGITNGSG
ncbi:MAG: DUF4347 domain-containing protein, partial [Rhodocyclaceae bacterium]|nr:DUF4347 domain-containing protein [Rhodocyclaceae bacterium]